jgi:hypothetical protein
LSFDRFDLKSDSSLSEKVFRPGTTREDVLRRSMSFRISLNGLDPIAMELDPSNRRAGNEFNTPQGTAKLQRLEVPGIANLTEVGHRIGSGDLSTECGTAFPDEFNVISFDQHSFVSQRIKSCLKIWFAIRVIGKSNLQSAALRKVVFPGCLRR